MKIYHLHSGIFYSLPLFKWLKWLWCLNKQLCAMDFNTSRLVFSSYPGGWKADSPGRGPGRGLHHPPVLLAHLHQHQRHCQASQRSHPFQRWNSSVKSIPREWVLGMVFTVNQNWNSSVHSRGTFPGIEFWMVIPPHVCELPLLPISSHSLVCPKNF